jgi:hypothetical protein
MDKQIITGQSRIVNVQGIACHVPTHVVHQACDMENDIEQARDMFAADPSSTSLFEILVRTIERREQFHEFLVAQYGRTERGARIHTRKGE